MMNINDIKEALRNGCIFFQLQDDVELVEIKKGNRLVLHYDQDPTKPSFHEHMIRLERWMKDYLKEKHLDLVLEPIEDKNRRHIRSGRVEKTTKLVNARGVDKLELSDTESQQSP